MTRKTAPRRTKASQPRPEYPQRWLERYGRTLTGDDIQLVQARRGLPPEQQAHLNAYAAGLVVEHASHGRVTAARRAVVTSRRVPRGAR